MAADEQRDLASWKEIADRLQVTVRTAQEWEKKRGLPVRRVPGGRGRVYMRVDELEAWLERGDGPSDEGRASSGGARPWVWPAVALTTIALAVVLLFLSRGGESLGTMPQPYDWRVTRDAVVILDENGGELWRAAVDEELRTESYDDTRMSVPEFVDLDGDDRPEVLVPIHRDEYSLPDPLVCFDTDGRELWRYSADAELETVRDPFENIYDVAAFTPVRLPDGSMGIVVASIHYAYYPTQIALLSADGDLLAEYWHAGHIANWRDRLTVEDYDGDGRLEVFAAGVSNAHKQATLVVLDLETMSGASLEEDSNYQFLGLDPAGEIARVLFPRSSLNLEYAFNVVDHIWLTPETINVQVREGLDDPTSPSLIYHLRSDFTRDRVVTTTTFDSAYARLLQEGAVSTSLEEELEALPALKFVGTPRALHPGR